MSLDYSPLQNAISQLEEALDLYGSELAKSDPRLKRHLGAAVIQAFKFTYELSFKMLKRYLKSVSANPAEFDEMSFNDVIREAFKRSLVQTELSVWREYRCNRGTANHTYDEKKAQEVINDVPIFFQEACYLLTRLQEKNETIDQPC